MAKVTVSFTYDDEADKDIARWLNRLPKRKRSEAIRAALRDHLGRGGVTLGDVYQAVKALERKLGAGVVIAGTQGQDTDMVEEPPDAAAALDALAAMG